MTEIDWAQAADDELVCYCNRVTKAQVVDAIRMGACTVPLIKTATQAGRGKDCKRVHPEARTCEGDLDQLLDLYCEGERPTVGCSCGCGCG